MSTAQNVHESSSAASGRKFICAFRGRRDDYQVPVSLHEISRLEFLLTDFYTPSFFLRTGLKIQKFKSRFNPLLPGSKVMSVLPDIIKFNYYRLLGYNRSRIYTMLDKDFSLQAAKLAEKYNSNLFLYTPYAWEAFTYAYSQAPKKILFQYHPHGALEREILLEDISKHPEYGFSIDELADSGLSLSIDDRKRSEDAWKFSDKIICASTFTKNSLVKAGAPANKCFVVPYGIETKDSCATDLFDEFTFLFVGSGIQRKGLHVLLKAWEQSNLFESSMLIIVSRDIEKNIEARIPKNRNIMVRNDVGNDELKVLYSKSHLFVLPSLVEGFGQVFLEALACGCPVLGTRNTCLPDIGTEKEGVFVSEAGDYRALSEKLIYLRKFLEVDNLRSNAFETAKRNTWEQFRRRIQSIVLNKEETELNVSSLY